MLARSWPYVLAAVAAAIVVAYLSAWGRRYGLDLKVYRDAVGFWRSARNPYLATFTASRLPFTYPPFALLALSPLAWASFPVTQWLLWAASIAAATGSVVLVLRDRGLAVTPRLWCKALAWSCLAAVVLEPARSGIDYGQIEFVLMLIVVADLLLVPPPYRGILTGIAAAMKLTPLVFVIVPVVSRDLKSAARTAASFLACTAACWLAWPGLSHLYWFRDVHRPGRTGVIGFAGNQSLYAILHRPPFPASGSAFAWLLVSALVLAAGAFAAWRCVNAGQRGFAVVAVALAGLLVSPVSWTHHWIWALLIPPLLLADRSRRAVPKSVRIMLWGIVALTVAAPYWWFRHGIAADALAAVLPLWTAGMLTVWAAAQLVTWRDSLEPSRARAVSRWMDKRAGRSPSG